MTWVVKRFWYWAPPLFWSSLTSSALSSILSSWGNNWRVWSTFPLGLKLQKPNTTSGKHKEPFKKTWVTFKNCWDVSPLLLKHILFDLVDNNRRKASVYSFLSFFDSRMIQYLFVITTLCYSFVCFYPSSEGHGKTPKDAASVRATHPIPAACGVYYFEVKIISKGRDG